MNGNKGTPGAQPTLGRVILLGVWRGELGRERERERDLGEQITKKLGTK